MIFRKYSERPWLNTCWFFLLGFRRRLSLPPYDRLHLDVFWDIIADARGPLPCARGTDMRFATLGMPSLAISGIGAPDSHSSMVKTAEGQ